MNKRMDDHGIPDHNRPMASPKLKPNPRRLQIRKLDASEFEKYKADWRIYPHDIASQSDHDYNWRIRQKRQVSAVGYGILGFAAGAITVFILAWAYAAR